MGTKVFVGFCNMDTELGSNFFHHSCLTFLEADTDDHNNITSPLRVTNAFGFYSHILPASPSPIFDTFTFFTKQIGLKFRLRGSFGIWKQEHIHDLTYGRGLSGQILEMDQTQINEMINSINSIIHKQNELFIHANSISEQEEIYQAAIDNKTLELIDGGMDENLAYETAKNTIPLREFKFGFHGSGYNCKIAALGMLESHSNMLNHKIAHRINELKVNSALPRFTHHLHNIVIHGMTDQWEPRGTHNKYPYFSWTNINKESQSPLVVVDFGCSYIDKHGDIISIHHLSKESLSTINHLKNITRICEINISDDDFKNWHAKISRIIHNISCSKYSNQEIMRTEYANDYLTKLINSDAFNKIKSNTPLNLLTYINETQKNYEIKRPTMNLLYAH